MLSALGTYLVNGHNESCKYHTLEGIFGEVYDNLFGHAAPLSGRRHETDWGATGSYIRERSFQREGLSCGTALRMETRQVSGQGAGLAYAGIGCDSFKDLKASHLTLCVEPLDGSRSRLTLVVKDSSKAPHEQNAFLVAFLDRDGCVELDLDGVATCYSHGGNARGYDDLAATLNPAGLETELAKFAQGVLSTVPGSVLGADGGGHDSSPTLSAVFSNIFRCFDVAPTDLIGKVEAIQEWGGESRPLLPYGRGLGYGRLFWGEKKGCSLAFPPDADEFAETMSWRYSGPVLRNAQKYPSNPNASEPVVLIQGRKIKFMTNDRLQNVFLVLTSPPVDAILGDRRITVAEKTLVVDPGPAWTPLRGSFEIVLGDKDDVSVQRLSMAMEGQHSLSMNWGIHPAICGAFPSRGQRGKRASAGDLGKGTIFWKTLGNITKTFWAECHVFCTLTPYDRSTGLPVNTANIYDGTKEALFRTYMEEIAVEVEKALKRIWDVHPELRFKSSLRCLREAGAVAKLLSKAKLAVESQFREAQDDGATAAAAAGSASSSAAASSGPFGYSARVAAIVGKHLKALQQRAAEQARRRAAENAAHEATITIDPGAEIWVSEGSKKHAAIFLGHYNNMLHVEFIDDNSVSELPWFQRKRIRRRIPDDDSAAFPLRTAAAKANAAAMLAKYNCGDNDGYSSDCSTSTAGSVGSVALVHLDCFTIEEGSKERGGRRRTTSLRLKDQQTDELAKVVAAAAGGGKRRQPGGGSAAAAAAQAPPGAPKKKAKPSPKKGKSFVEHRSMKKLLLLIKKSGDAAMAKEADAVMAEMRKTTRGSQFALDAGLS